MNPPATPRYETDPPATSKYESDPPATPRYETDPPATSKYESDPLATSKYESDPPATPRYETDPPATSKYESDPPATPRYETDPPATSKYETNPLATPEYKTICSYQMILTLKLSNCFQYVAKYLHQSGALTDKQYRTIIRHRDGAEKLMEIIVDGIKDPDTTLDAFADFVRAIKRSGNKFLQTFLREEIESKRKQLYRELLKVPPGM